MSKKAIGIDLGTTYSCVAYFEDGKVEIIENKFTGLRTTPSIVIFNENETSIGKPVKFSENVVYEIKRLIGKKFDDENVQNDIRKLSYKIININNKPIVRVNYKKNTYEFHPQQISAVILSKMKEIAELQLNQNVTDAVITVPAYFNDAQRQATKDAAEIAGLNVLRIMSEPTAAAVAYGYDKKIMTQKKVLVFDLGGGTFDVSIMKIENGRFTVIAVGGDSHLGGCDFDDNLLDYLVEIYKGKYGKDITENKKALFKLRNQCEIAKRLLSEVFETLIEIDDPFFVDEIFSEKISRALFERVNEPLFNKAITILSDTLESSQLKKNDIDDIVLVGGSTRIPKIKNLIREFFDGKVPFQNINADEAVAYGAALQAAILIDKTNPCFTGLQIVDVTPLSLGIEVDGDIMSVIVPRNTKIPNNIKKTFTTKYNQQSSICISVYQGERPLVRDNLFLGKFLLNDIQIAEAGVPKIEVTFTIDDNGILNVKAKDLAKLVENSICIENSAGKLDQKEIRKMVNLAKEFEKEDKLALERAKARNSLEVFCNKRINSRLESTRNQMNEILNWIKNESITTNEILNKLNYLEQLKI